MKKIYINGRFLSQKTTGVQRVAEEIIKELDSMINTSLNDNFEFVILSPNNVIKDLELKNIRLIKLGILKGHMWEQIILPFYSKKNLLINFCNTGPLFKQNQIVYIHDGAIYTRPEGFSKKFVIWYKVLYKFFSIFTKKIITVSNFSKEELISHLPKLYKKIHVTRLGIDHIDKIEKDDGILEKYSIDKRNYILAVGSLNPNKNFQIIISAIDQLKKFDGQIVIAGGINKKIFSTESANIKGKLKYVGYVTDEELISLYSNAKLFIFPSLYEGFGLPPLEAMKLECPVIASNFASIPEVCKNGVIYFNPLDSNDLVNKIETIFSNKINLNDLTKKGLKVVNDYKWSNTAIELIEIIKNL